MHNVSFEVVVSGEKSWDQLNILCGCHLSNLSLRRRVKIGTNLLYIFKRNHIPQHSIGPSYKLFHSHIPIFWLPIFVVGGIKFFFFQEVFQATIICFNMEMFPKHVWTLDIHNMQDNNFFFHKFISQVPLTTLSQSC